MSEPPQPSTVSVVIPTYNRAHRLAAAIESVMTQELLPVEVIVVDDGSQDETRRVVNELQDRWGEALCYLRQDHAERSIARNRGILASTGDLIAFLDSDDIWRRDHLRRCVDELRRHPAAVAAFADYGLVSEAGETVVERFRRRMPPDWELQHYLLLKRLIIHPSEMVVRRDSLLAIHGGQAFDPELSGSEDWLLWVMLSAVGELRPTGEQTVWLRMSPDGTFADPDRFCQAILLGAEKVIATSVAAKVGVRPNAIRAVCRRNAAGAYARASRRGEALHLLVGSMSAWPGTVREREFWQVCRSVILGARGAMAARRLRRLLHSLSGALAGGRRSSLRRGGGWAAADQREGSSVGGVARCPLCGGDGALRASWVGSLRYDGRRFSYLECDICASLRCDPMPDDAVAASMYGPGYAEAGAAPYEVEGPRQPERVLAVLDGHRPGTFLDFGCGGGEMLGLARDRGWRAVGVELDRTVVEEVSRRLGLEVLSYADVAASAPGAADVLHAGDVLEHLTHLDCQFPVMLGLVKPGGLVVAQGPLEANFNLFTGLLRWWGRLRPHRERDFPPWHVLLATAAGQRAFFRRFGLEELSFSVSEVDWPAPSTLSAADLRQPRVVALYLVRRLSQVVTGLGPAHWGNRYFYVGRWPGPGSPATEADQEGGPEQSEPCAG